MTNILFFCTAVSALRDSGSLSTPLSTEDTIQVTDCDGVVYALPTGDSAQWDQILSAALIQGDGSGMAAAIDMFVQAKIAKLQGIVAQLQVASADQTFMEKLRSIGQLNMCTDPNDPDAANSDNIATIFGENPAVFGPGVLDDEPRNVFLSKQVKHRRQKPRLFHSDQAQLTVGDILPGNTDLHLFQGDMLYAKSAVLMEPPVSPTPASDTVYWNSWALWPNAQVNWYVDTAAPVDACATATFASASSLVEKYTCLRFTQGSTPVNGAQSVKLTSNGDTCWAYVGMSPTSQVNLGGSGCQIPGIALHELGHAIGLIHQQSREDRDTYVTIGWGNVREGTQDNFLKIQSSSDFDRIVAQQAYDYTSVMHYSACEFSTTRFDDPCGETIKPASASFLNEMGQRDHLSPLDIQTINAMYGCTATCGDGVQNQGEEGIDCGGPCRRVCNDSTSDGIIPLPASCQVDNTRALTTTEIIILIVAIGIVALAVCMCIVICTVVRNRRKAAAKLRLLESNPDQIREALIEAASAPP